MSHTFPPPACCRGRDANAASNIAHITLCLVENGAAAEEEPRDGGCDVADGKRLAVVTWGINRNGWPSPCQGVQVSRQPHCLRTTCPGQRISSDWILVVWDCGGNPFSPSRRLTGLNPAIAVRRPGDLNPAISTRSQPGDLNPAISTRSATRRSQPGDLLVTISLAPPSR